MKISCPTCGVHFPGDFHETISENCKFWESLKFPNDFPMQDKQRIWDWLFALDRDELALRTNIAVDVQLRATQAFLEKGKNDFEVLVPAYGEWPEEKRQEFQKAFTLFVREADIKTRASWTINSFLADHPEWAK